MVKADMEHTEAIRQMAPEKYLLNELSPEHREQFEEHYFSCQECALEVRAGAAFLAQSKVLLSQESTPQIKTAAKEQKSGWFAWLKPAFAIPVMAVLLIAVAYQGLVESPRLQKMAAAAVNPQILGSVTLVAGNTRGATLPSVKTKQGEAFLVALDIPPTGQFSSYTAQLNDPSGASEWTMTIPQGAAKDTVPVRVPGVKTAGTYTLVVRGVNGDVQTEIGRSSFEVQF
ncbi:MAG TPA: zf-HC2 domain-containing protein [Terriglobales bacterium]|jgi:hypothetical protein